ncbi:MAG: helix-turn-helix domain-containing protein [Rhodospirillaceae bacterium]
MAILVTLDVVLAQRGMRARELAQKIGITEANLSLFRRGHVRGLRFDTLSALCELLNCQPGDLLRYEPDADTAEG